MSEEKSATPELTPLEAIEKARMDGVVENMRKVLPEGLQGAPGIDKALADMAEAAVEALHRNPEGDYPFGRNLNVPPRRCHPSTLQGIQEIDAGLFSGDTFMETDAHLYLAAHVQRWSKALTNARKDDWYNRPDEPEDDEGFEP
jgi:hypothetical protein